MVHLRRTLALTFSLAALISVPCMGQDVEPPFTWQGKGAASIISQEGIEKIDFQFEMSLDEQERLEGRTTNEDGSSAIKHVFYSEPKYYELPGFFTRNVVIVLMLNEYGGTPMLSVLNGRLLIDKFLYGEVSLARYEAGSDTAKGLGVGDPRATPMYGDELPSSLKSAMTKCLPIGAVTIEGGYVTRKSTEGASGDAGSIALFNGKNLEGWHVYLSEADVDPESVWKIQDSTILCTGKPVGFLRTSTEYSDYKLTLEWRWVGTPGNSGVLVRMSGEDKIWPLCMEAQLMHTKAGDFVGMGTGFNENVVTKPGPISYAPRKNESSEAEPGGWNKYEILCKGDTIALTVNGQLQNKATGVALKKGYIGLQSEGAPIMFRNIKLTPFK